MVSAGIVSETDALRLVHKRGALMHREALANPGHMAAVIGLDMGAVLEIVAEAKNGEILDVANHNTAQQIVITGQKDPVARAVKMAKEKKAKAIPLKVSGAWHSGLMQGGVDEFRAFMEDIPFSSPRSDMIFNATAQCETDPERIKDIMANQLVSPVKWYDIMRKMLDDGVDTFVEVGPKKVLAGLLKRLPPPMMPSACLQSRTPRAWKVRWKKFPKASSLIEPILSHDAYGHVSFFLSSCSSRYRLTSSPLPNPPRPPAATTRCHGKIRGRGFLPMACPTARAPLGFPAMAATWP